MTDTITTLTTTDVEALLVGASDTDGKTPSNAAPVLRAFVESKQPAMLVDMKQHPGQTTKSMVQHFKNAARATRHNVLLDAPEYVIPGAYHVEPLINGKKQLVLKNTPVYEEWLAKAAAAKA